MERKNLVTSGFLRESKNVFEDLTLYRPTHMRMNRLVNRIVHRGLPLKSKGLHHCQKALIEESRRKDYRTGIKELTTTFGIQDDHSAVMEEKSRCKKFKRKVIIGGFTDNYRRHPMRNQKECRLDHADEIEKRDEAHP